MAEKQFDKIKYNNQFNAQNYDRINYTIPKGKREIIKAAAERRGMSTNAYINAAVDAALAADGVAVPEENTTDESGL